MRCVLYDDHHIDGFKFYLFIFLKKTNKEKKNEFENVNRILD